MSLKTKKSGGGCACGGGCGCGSTDVAARGTAFVRPRFFGGMLLTEDDLESLTDYVIGKRRLTNRYVFGPGVVCGLTVSCDPCDRGSVVVGPGYAIDCCGNDVVVDCPTQVDIIALVRELRQRSGVDCGEPCEDQPCAGYVLNIVYTEQPSDPVAPYADDDCTVGDCEFSRVREGYRFELSCDAPEPEPTMIDILKECRRVDDERVNEDAQLVAEVFELGMSWTKVPRADIVAAQPLSAVTDVNEAEADIPVKSDFDDMDRDDAEFGDALELVVRGTRALARDAASRAGRGPKMPMNSRWREVVRTRTRDLGRRLLASEELAAMPAAERADWTPLLDAAVKQRNLENLTVPDVHPRYDPVANQEEYARKGKLAQSRVERMFIDAGRAGCKEYRDVAALKFHRIDENAPRTVVRLLDALLAVLGGCVCDAATPRCPSCTDARIPLARLRVDGCDVVSICALERRWVNSPRALAYWFPIVEALRQTLEQRCCPDECDDRPDMENPTLLRQRGREREADILRKQADEWLRLVRPPEEMDELRGVFAALGGEFVASPPSMQPKADEGARVAALEKQVEDLNKRVEELTRKWS